MKKLCFLLLLITFSVFSQETEYKFAKKYLKDNQLEEATLQIQRAIKKQKKTSQSIIFCTLLS